MIYGHINLGSKTFEASTMEPTTLDHIATGTFGDTKRNALDTQVGGDHYKKLKIQPMEYAMANKLDPCQQTIIKYVTRFRDKGGIEDLEKAKQTIDLLIHFERLRVKG